MEQGVPGSQNDHFFELLHPNPMRGPPPPPPLPPPSSSSSPPPPPPVESAADGSPSQDPSPLHSITPSYDFHLTHSANSGEMSTKLEDAPPVFHHRVAASAADHLQATSFDTSRGFGHGKPIDATDALDRVTMDAIDRTMKRHTDNLLHVLECVSGRLLQLESTVQALEHTVSGLKSAEGEKQDQSNGRLIKLESLIEEVNRGLQLLHEKHRLDEAKSQLTKLQLDEQKPSRGGLPQTPAEAWQQSKAVEEVVPQGAYSESPPQLPQHLPPQYAPQAQSHYPHAPPPQMQAFTTSQSMVPLQSSMNGPPALPQPYPPTGGQHPPQQPSAQSAPPPPQQIPAFHSQPSPQLPPPSSYNMPMETTAYSHMQPQHHLPPPPTPPSGTYIPEPSQYGGGMHGGPRQPPMPQEVLHPSQQHNPVGPQHVYEPIAGRMGPPASSMAPSYTQPAMPKPAPPVPPMYETTGNVGYGSPYRAAQSVPSAPGGGSAGYPRLPTAQPVQHGLPAANPISSGPSTRSPLDDVIERVVNMGFPREQVRGVVRQLTENGQPVDLNVVLDKLMNGGDPSQPARGWFNRG